MNRDIKLNAAFVPASRATANTTYNGTATVTDAVGIAVKNAKTAYVHINLGAVGATTVDYTLMASILAAPTAAGDLTAITGATIQVVPGDANTQKVVAVRIDRAALPVALQSDPLYLYVKRVQVGAVATLDAVSIALTDHSELPVLVKAGAAADVEALG